MLENDFVVYLAFGNRLSAGVSLLVGRNLDAIVNVFVDRKFDLWPGPVLPGQNVRRVDSDLVTCPTFQ